MVERPCRQIISARNIVTAVWPGVCLSIARVPSESAAARYGGDDEEATSIKGHQFLSIFLAVGLCTSPCTGATTGAD
jgi:hypothetical protein